MTTSTFAALRERFADFDLDLIHYPDHTDYQYELETMHGRETPRVTRFINLPAVESYLRYEENQSGMPQVAIPPADDDDFVTINISGTDLLLPRGSTVEDALQAYQDRENIGTADIPTDDAAYVLMLQSELVRMGLTLSVTDDLPDAPFCISKLEYLAARVLPAAGEFPQYYPTTRLVHKFIKLHSGEPTHEASNPTGPVQSGNSTADPRTIG